MARFRTPGFTILGALALLAFLNVTMVGCGDDDPAGPPADLVAPEVMTVDPADGSAGVSLNTPVTITFSEAIDPTTCTTSSVTINGVTGTVAASGAEVTFQPAAPLELLTTYQLTVTAAVCDVAGNGLAEPFTSSFTTADQPVADSGGDLFVARGSTVTLDASHSSAVSGGQLSYQWTQVAGPRMAVLQGFTPSFSAPSTVETIAFSLVVTEGGVDSEPAIVRILVMEDPAHGWFVHPAGSDQGAGTIDDPFVSVQRAIDAARGENAGGDLYLAGGTYEGSLNLVSDVSLYGAFDPDTWYREDGTSIESVIAGGPTAITAFGVSNLAIDGIAVESADAVEPGGSSVGILFDEAVGIVLSRSRVRAHNGLAGDPGIDGTQGLPGANGGNGSGRTGGTGASGAGWAGGRGGTGGPDWYSGSRGNAGAGPGGGGGGFGGSYGGNNGGGGANGTDATPSQNGNGGSGYGAWVNSYEPARGENGERRDGGGGGGGGGGGAEGVQNGGGGGGGGAGGQGGRGGAGGHGGGASIAVVLVNGSDVAITNCSLQTGNGGTGGYGGVGGPGAPGGTGGGSGSPQSGLFLKGGYGGVGGRGGHGAVGGIGGGGGGGPVIGVLEIQSSSARTNVSFELGTPGAGGLRPDETGTAGSVGDTVEYKSMI